MKRPRRPSAWLAPLPWLPALALAAAACVAPASQGPRVPQARARDTPPSGAASNDVAASAPERHPSSEAYRALLVAEGLVRRGQRAQAIDAYRSALLHDPASPELRVRLAELLVEADDVDEAQRQVRRAMQADPTHLASARLHARLLVQQGELARARAFLEDQLGRHPGDPILQELLAERHVQEGRFWLAEGLAPDPEAPAPARLAGHQMLARLFALHGEVERALAQVQLALAIDDANPDVLELWRTLLWATGDDEGALVAHQRWARARGTSSREARRLGLVAELLARGVEAGDEVARAWLDEDIGSRTLFDVASAFETVGLRARARAWLEEAAARSPRPELAWEAGRLALAERDAIAATRLLCDDAAPRPRALRKRPARIRGLCARALLERGERARARREVLDALADAPTSWHVLSAWLALRERAREDQAERPADGDVGPLHEALARARALAPDDDDLLALTVQALEDEGRHQEAQQMLELALRAPQLPRARSTARMFLLAQHFARRPEPHTALRIVDDLRARRAADVDLLNFAAYTAAQHRLRLEEARRDAWGALVRRPLSGHLLDTLGWCEFQAGRVAPALRILARADRLTPDEPEIMFHLAAAWYATGEKAQARALAERAWRLAAHDPPLREAIRAWLFPPAPTQATP